MQLPTFLYGCHIDVQKHVHKKIKMLRRGASPDDIVDAWTETAKVDGLIALSGPSPLLRASHHFQCFSLTRELWREIPKRLPRTFWDGFFEAALRSTWLLLSFMFQETRVLLHEHPDWQLPFLLAVARHWDEYDSLGARYTIGLDCGTRLWELPTNIKFALGHRGIPVEELNTPLPAGGLAALVAQAQNSPSPKNIGLS